MTLHLVKLCVGVSSVEELRSFQKQRLASELEARKRARLVHRTRQMPRRRDELCDGGSIYWVIKGAIQARQALLGVEEGQMLDGRNCCELVLDPDLVFVQPAPRRAFQGWRYLEFADAPPDLRASQVDAVGAMPPQMRRELIELALL